MKPVNPKYFIINSRIILFCFLQFVAFILKAEGNDSLKNKFDINDPRNPQCPCHKYQKKADEEYKNLVALNHQKTPLDHNPVEKNFNDGHPINIQDHPSFAGKDKIKKDRKDYSVRHKRKKHGKKYNSWIRILDASHWNIWKRLPKTDACSKWR